MGFDQTAYALRHTVETLRAPADARRLRATVGHSLAFAHDGRLKDTPAAHPLELVDSLELGDYRYLHSTRAELLRRLGRQEEARAACEHALRLAATDPERRFLARRLAGL